MGGVDDYDIHSGGDQGVDTLHPVIADSDGGADAQAAEVVLAGVGILAYLFDVLDGDQTLELALIVDHKQLFDAVPVQVLLGLLEGCSRRNRHQLILGHDVGNRLLEPGFETQIPVGENAHQFARLGDRHAGDAVFLHQGEGFVDLLVRIHGDRVDDHAAFALFDLVDLQGLIGRGHVLVNNPDAAFTRHADRRPRLGDGIHRRRKKRDVQRDFRGQPGGKVNVLGQDGGSGGQQEDIIEGQTFGDIWDQHQAAPLTFSRTIKLCPEQA